MYAHDFSPVVLPNVFQIGDYQEEYEVLQRKYSASLLEVCDKDMQQAYTKLNSLYQEMEAYATSKRFDIKGVRVWLHFFWDKDGSIQHLAYHLRPNSRNINRKELEIFLLHFIHYYRFPVTSQQRYSLYTSAAFPVYAIRKRGN